MPNYHIPKYNDSAFPASCRGRRYHFIKNNIFKLTVPTEKLEFHRRNINQIVHDGINCKPAGE